MSDDPMAHEDQNCGFPECPFFSEHCEILTCPHELADGSPCYGSVDDEEHAPKE